jgi:hypothetical protein
MDNFACFPHNLRWTAQLVTDAVPLRLHELYAISVGAGAGREAANGIRMARRPRAAYTSHPPLPARFRVA